MMRIIAALACLVVTGNAWSMLPFLLRNPSLNQDRIAFLYANDIWTVPRAGGEATRLTSVGDVSDGPYFSPDGTRIAYSGGTHGLIDVYVVATSGGVPRRLTWEPMGNRAVGWTPDGKDVLFASQQVSYSDFPRLFRAMQMAPAHQPYYHCPPQYAGPIQPTVGRSHTSPMSSGSGRGSDIVVDKRRRSGSPT